MAWFRSILVRADQTVTHVFACPACSSIGETSMPVKSSRHPNAPEPKRVAGPLVFDSPKKRTRG
jgi:hypothetical protein